MRGSLMTPIPISGLLYLLQSGYPADLVLRMTVSTMNGLQNAYGGQGNPLAGDSRFFVLIEKMRVSQAAGGMGLRLKQAHGQVMLFQAAVAGQLELASHLLQVT